MIIRYSNKDINQSVHQHIATCDPIIVTDLLQVRILSVPVLRPLGRQDSEDLDRLIVATDTGLLWLNCLLFDSEWFWDDLIDSWTDYLMSPFEDYPLNDAQ